MNMPRYSLQPIRIALAVVDRHPDNPRLGTHDDTVLSFRARLHGSPDGYPAESAIKLRQLENGRYQVIDGHHRLDAALAEQLDHVMAFVATMSDQEALESLLLSNVQQGFTPLEIGLHLLKVVRPGQGKAGGGLDGFAKANNLPAPTLRRYRHAANAFLAARPMLSPAEVKAAQKRAEGLAKVAIGAPRELWPELACRCIREKWTAADAKRIVAQVVETQARGADGQAAASANAPAKWPARSHRRPQTRRSNVRNTKTQLVNSRMPIALVESLKKHALAHGVSFSKLLNWAVEAGLPLVLEQRSVGESIL
jgi:ParB-like chromosome segregation protein Spo0J